MLPEVLLYSPMTEEVFLQLKQLRHTVYIEKSDPDFFEKIADILPTVKGIIGDGLPIDEHLLQKTPALKVVSNISVGYDNLDIKALTERRIMATNTPDVLTETTADLMFALLLATARRIGQLDRYVKNGHWTGPLSWDLMGTDVHHKTLGIIGMGRIGEAIARRGKFGFGMSILYHNRSRKRETEQQLSARYCSLDELLRQSDFVCLMTPLTPETEHLIGQREFSLMKESAIFINGSRGKTVDEQALVDALQSKAIAGAGLDVFQEEPIPTDHPLLQFDHVVTLPHVGSDTYENKKRMDELAVKNLLNALEGKRPPNLINPEVVDI